MIKLIRNEFFKIFHKITIYIFFVIGVIGYVLLGGLSLLDMQDNQEYFANNMNNESFYKENAKAQLKELKCDELNCDKKYNEFVTLQANLTIKYFDFKDKYQKSDKEWQREYIKGLLLAESINKEWYDYANDSKNKAVIKDMKEISEEIDKRATYLDENNSEAIIELEINILSETIEKLEAEEEVNKRIYMEALAKYKELCMDADFNSKTDSWQYGDRIYTGEPYYSENYELELLRLKKVYFEQMKGYGLDNVQRDLLAKKYAQEYNDLINNKSQENERALAFADYSLKHNVDWNIDAGMISLKEILITNVSFFFLAFAIVLLYITSTIFSEEYSKGTIKFLLTTPNSRIKVFLSKFITSIIMSLILIILMIIGYCISYGFFNGDILLLFKESPLYNYKTGNVISIPLIINSLITAAGLIPNILIIIVISILFSILTESNKSAYIVPLSCVLGTTAMISIMNLFVKKWFIHILNILPFASWNFNEFLFGKIPDYKMISFNEAIIISSSWFIVLFILSMVLFKKKDIKNN